MSDVNATQVGTWNINTISSGLPTGANLIGNVDISVWPGLATGANTIGAVTLAGGIFTGANTIGTVFAVGPVAANVAYPTSNTPVVTAGVYYSPQPTVNANCVTWFATTTRAAQIVATGVDTFTTTVGAISAGLYTGSNNIGVVNVAGNATQNAAFSANVPLIMGGVYNASLPTINSTCVSSFQLDVAGRLICNTTTTIGGLSTGSNTIGAVYTSGTEVEVVPTVTAGAYNAGQTMGGIITFSNMLATGANNGWLESITLKFKATLQITEFDVAIFTTSPTGTFTDRVTPAIATTDTAFLLGIYRCIAYQSCLGTHTVYNLDGIFKRITGASTSLYAVVITKSAPVNPASTTDMSLRLGVAW